MADLPVDKLRAEFRSDIKDLKLELSKDLEVAVCRIEQAIKAHSEGSSARQSDIVKRFEAHEDILTLIVRLVAASAEGSPPIANIPQPPADYSNTPSRRN